MTNCNDRYDLDPAGNPKKETGVTVAIPFHKIANWYRDWRNRKNKIEISKNQNYEDTVKDYRQDL